MTQVSTLMRERTYFHVRAHMCLNACGCVALHLYACVSYAPSSTANLPTITRVGADADSARPVLRPPPCCRGGDPLSDENTSCSPCEIITTSRSGGVTFTPDMITLAIGDVSGESARK